MSRRGHLMIHTKNVAVEQAMKIVISRTNCMVAFVPTARRRCCSSFMISVLVLRTFPSEVVLTGLPNFSGCGKTGLVPSVFEMFTMKI